MINKVIFINLGRFKSSEYEELFRDYVSRLSHYCKVEVAEIRVPRDEPGLLDKLNAKVKVASKGSKLIVFSERGVDQTSIGFSKWVERSEGHVSLLVGTAWGLPAWAEENAALKLSFGRFTFPHEAVRVLCAEQMYRAFTIIRGQSYHK